MHLSDRVMKNIDSQEHGTGRTHLTARMRKKTDGNMAQRGRCLFKWMKYAQHPGVTLPGEQGGGRG